MTTLPAGLPAGGGQAGMITMITMITMTTLFRIFAKHSTGLTWI
jgi:hypothetical protein